MKRSIIAFAATGVLGLLSMGAMGAVLYYAAWPILGPFHGNLADWQGDWVWPATIFAGMLWSIGFLLAGGIDRFAPVASRLLGLGRYAFVVWLWAVIVWAAVLALV